MKPHLYLSLIPESLVASMLSPKDFGSYYATGPSGRSRGQAIFFEVDPALKSDYFNLGRIKTHCVPHADGRPRSTTYLAAYRVLEHVPLEALGKLYLATNDGKVLALEKAQYVVPPEPSVHLYQEFCPMGPRVASRLGPLDFCRVVTDRTLPVSVPKIVFAELILRELREDPDAPEPGNLPYSNIDHVRDCLKTVSGAGAKDTKLVVRNVRGDVLYRTIKNGFFVGAGETCLFYPMPSREHLENEHYDWWRSALATFGE
jgi:hypothetical protein